MSTAHKIFHNTAWQIALRVISIFLGIVSYALIARILGQQGFGYFSTVSAFVQTYMIIADLGLYLTLLREISASDNKQDEQKIINNIFTIRLFSAAIVLLLVPLTIIYLPYDQAVKQGAIYILLAFFVQSLISTLTAILAKAMAMPKAGLVDIFSKILFVATLYFLFINGGSLNLVLLSQSLASLVSLVLFFYFLRSYTKIKLAWDFSYWRHVFKIAWPLAIGVILNLLYFKTDTLILAAYHSPDQVGLYGASYRFLEVLTTFPHMFMSLILPLFTLAWTKKELQKINDIEQNAFDFFVMINVWLLLVVWLMSTPLMILLAGTEFSAAGPILNVLILAVVAIFFGTMFTYLVVALGLQKKMVKYYLLAAIFGVAAYFIFIPKYSYWAAAWVTVAVEIFVWVCAFILVKKMANISLKFNILGKTVLVGVISFLFFWPLRHWPVILLAPLVSVFYFLFLILFKVIDKNKINILLNKKKNV